MRFKERAGSILSVKPICSITSAIKMSVGRSFAVLRAVEGDSVHVQPKDAVAQSLQCYCEDADAQALQVKHNVVHMLACQNEKGTVLTGHMQMLTDSASRLHRSCGRGAECD